MSRNLDHIIVAGTYVSSIYTSPNTFREKDPIERDRNVHGQRIKSEFENAINVFKNESHTDFVYLEFVSEKDCVLAFDRFEDGRRGDHRFISSKLEIIEINGNKHEQYRACVFLNPIGISKFLTKIENYLTQETPTGKPKNKALINNIASIQKATLKSFWHETEDLFPDENTEIWWEVWLRRENYTAETEDQEVIDYLISEGIQVARRRLVFPEYIVRMIKSTANKLSTTLLYTDKLAELRKPKETAEFFTGLSSEDAFDWISDLRERVIDNTSDESVIISILDTGVNRGHPLLQNFLPEKNMDSINPEWGTADSSRFGHGTQMASVSLYGDLSDILHEISRVEIYHTLESIKLIHPNNPHKPDLYGAVTEEAVARAIILNPQNKRILLMAVTTPDGRDKGKPSSWSSAVDKICFGLNGISNDKFSFCISGGNVTIFEKSEFPTKNISESIHDPSQAYNAITVGAYTNKAFIDQNRFPGATLITKPGSMAPSNSTSISWENSWPIKPEIVLEGGNLGIFNNGIIDPDSLTLLSANNEFQTEPLSSFGATSGASALAARFTAILSSQYPNLWPESIKALLIHSAEWTNEMLNGKNITELNKHEKIALLRSVGYGIPNLNKAIKSAKNSLTLIAQEQLSPYRLEGSRVKTNEMHMHELPWPKEALEELFDQEVTVTATLSYFIEPNPGNKLYSKSYNYQSHGLRFKMIEANETPEHFMERINREARDEEDNTSYSGESWLLGTQTRDKGSIHKDIWKGTAIDLANRNWIAITPVNGWWRSRKKLNRYNQSIRYSLVVTIDSGDNDIDLYSPVINLIDISI